MPRPGGHEHHRGPGQHLGRPDGEQAGITRPGANEVHGHPPAGARPAACPLPWAAPGRRACPLPPGRPWPGSGPPSGRAGRLPEESGHRVKVFQQEPAPHVVQEVVGQGRAQSRRVAPRAVLAGPEHDAAVAAGQQALDGQGAVRLLGGVGRRPARRTPRPTGEERPSASTARRALTSSMVASSCAVAWSSARHSTPSAPWPIWGSITDGSSNSLARSASPRRRRAAAATTTALWSPAWATRVAMCPAGRRRSGPVAARPAGPVAAPDPVPISAPTGNTSRVQPTRASRGSSRAGTLASTKPGAVADEVLGRVDGHVGPTVQHRLLDLLHEHALAPHLPHRHVPTAVAGGLDHDQFHHQSRVDASQPIGHQAGLPEGQFAASSRDEEPVGHRRGRWSRDRTGPVWPPPAVHPATSRPPP